MKYKYWAFGLLVHSTIEFPELLPDTGIRADVSIVTGNIPPIKALTTFNTGGITYQMNEQELLIQVKDIGSYYVAGGNRIIVCVQDPAVEARLLRVFILSGCMTGILLQRRHVPLHASAIRIDDQLVLIGGASGAGKSTALTGLKARGYRMFSDDITVLRQLPDDDQIRGWASYPMVKLWEHTLQSMALNDRSFPVLAGMQKYGVFFHETFDTGHYTIGRIILLEKQETADRLRVRSLKGSEAFANVVSQVYRPVFFRDPEVRAVCFDVVSKMVRQAAVHLISRPAICNPVHLLDTISSLLT